MLKLIVCDVLHFPKPDRIIGEMITAAGAEADETHVSFAVGYAAWKQQAQQQQR